MSSDDELDVHVDWHRGLIPVSLLVLVVLRFGFGTPIWALALLSLWIPVYYVGYPRFVKRRWEDFERDFTLRFQKGNHRELLDDYQSRWFLRHFGPKGKMLEKLGLIYAALDKYREAEHVFEQALDEQDSDETNDKLLFNLANIKYELGKYEDAEEIYRSLQGNSPYGHSIRTQLALIDFQKGRRVEEAREFLEQERDRASGMMRDRIEEALG